MGRLNVLDKLVQSESSNISLQKNVHDLERQLRLTQNEVERLQDELKATKAHLNAAEQRATASQKALLEVQESTNRIVVAEEENAKRALDTFKKEAAKWEEAATKTFKLELESMMSAFDAVKKAESIIEQAYLRRFEALERALNAAEAIAKAWKERAQTTELLLHKAKEGDSENQETQYVLNGGRMELLIRDDKRRWNLSCTWSKKRNTRMDGTKDRECVSKIPSHYA